MASKYLFQAIDFDELFAPYTSGAKAQPTGFKINGVDLSDKYAPISAGSKRADVHYFINGVDISNFFAASGTAVYWLPFNGRSFFSNVIPQTGSQGNTTATLTLAIRTDGKYQVYDQTGSMQDEGTWLPAGQSSANYVCRFAAAGNTRTTVSTNAPSDAPLSQTRVISVAATVLAQSSDNINETLTIDCVVNGPTGNTLTRCYFTVSASGWI